MLKFLSLLIFLITSALAGDHLILIGTAIGKYSTDQAIKKGAYDEATHTLDAKKYSETVLMQTICNSYSAAKAKGVQVTMLIGANLKCPNGTLINSHPDCGIHSCSEKVIKKALKKASSKIKQGDNLVLQTAAHGEDGTGDLYLNDAEGKTLSKKEIAAALNQAGIPGKVKKINGVYFQCYSGHHNDLGAYLHPKVRYCSLAQAKPYTTAVISSLLRDKNANERSDTFTESVWDSFQPGKGMNFISTGAKVKTNNEWDYLRDSKTYKWDTSTLSSARKYFKKSNQSNQFAHQHHSIFGINDASWDTDPGFNTNYKPKWDFRNDFPSLNYNYGEFLKPYIEKSILNNSERLKSIEKLAKKWEKERRNRGWLAKGKELFGYNEDQTKFKDSENLVVPSENLRDTKSLSPTDCFINIAHDIRINQLAEGVTDSLAKKVFAQKQKEMNSLLSSSTFRESLRDCYKKGLNSSIPYDTIYRNFLDNERIVYSELNDLMRSMKKIIREDGKTYDEALNEKTSIKVLEKSDPLNTPSRNQKLEYYQLKTSYSNQKQVTYKEAINDLKKALSENYISTENNLKKKEDNLWYEVISCPAFKKYAPLMYEMNTLKKMNDIYKDIKDPRAKNDFINKLMCEMGY